MTTLTGAILRPHLPHHFAVYFRAVSQKDAGEVKKLVDVLTCQLITVQLPELALGGYVGTRPPGAFGSRRHAGNVKFVFQEDALGLVSEALEGLTDGSVQWLGATVCKLDGNESVLEAFDLRDLKFLSVQHSTLTYYSHGGSARGTITDQKLDADGNPQFTNVQLNFDNGSDSCSSQTITASADLILTARYPGGKPLSEILGEL
jgi:hypothetical protein